ncbi:MAG: hypothetical protein EBY20_01325 [Alphaproteobacteria bacterium]|nr:hypothetical protein [Alphaproteobacteria bacterium]
MQKKLLKKNISTSTSKAKRKKVNGVALQKPLLCINQLGFIFLRDLEKFGFKEDDILSSIKDAYLKGRISCGLWYIEENSKDYISLDESSFKSNLDTNWSHKLKLYEKYHNRYSEKYTEVDNNTAQDAIIASLLHNSAIHVKDIIKILNGKGFETPTKLKQLISQRIKATYKVFIRNKKIIEWYLDIKEQKPKMSVLKIAKLMSDIIEKINKLKEELSTLQDKMCREIKWKAQYGIDDINADTVGKFLPKRCNIKFLTTGSLSAETIREIITNSPYNFNKYKEA